MEAAIVVRAQWDAKAAVWFVEKSDIAGLKAEAWMRVAAWPPRQGRS